jgi:hypothetical protein
MGCSSGERVEGVDLDTIERDRGGGIAFVVVLWALARDEAGRRVAIALDDEQEENRKRDFDGRSDQHYSRQHHVMAYYFR